MGQKVTLDELFADLSAKLKAEADARDADPEIQRRETERRAAYAAQIDREIAEGKRDADGEWITVTCERCEEQMDAANVEAFEETGMLVCDMCADEVLAELGDD